MSESEPITTKNGHVLYSSKDCPYKKDEEWHSLGYCPVCDGGLGYCKICGMAESELDQPCPGQKA